MSFEPVTSLKSKEEMYLEVQEYYPDITAVEMSRVQPDLLLALHGDYPSIPTKRAVLISLEASRKRDRLSTTSFYADRAAKRGVAYWIRLAISYQGDD